MERNFSNPTNIATQIAADRPHVSWASIFAGALIALITQLALLSLGSAIGFSVFDPGQGERLTRGSLIASAVYTIIATLLSLYAGGWVAGRLAYYQQRSISLLHGLLTWTVVSAVTLGLMSFGVGRILGTTFGLLGSGIQGLGSVGVTAMQGAGVNRTNLGQEAKQILRETGKPELQPERLAQEAKKLPQQTARAQAEGAAGAETAKAQARETAGAVDRDAIANVLSKRLNISRDQALSLIGQGEEQANQVLAQIREQGPQVAQQGTEAAAGISWFAFLTLLLGALASALGGLTGGPLGLSRRQAAKRGFPISRAAA